MERSAMGSINGMSIDGIRGSDSPRLLGVLLLLLWTLLWRLPTFTQVVTVWDESLYFMIARDWLMFDILPYTGLFDHKPLGIYAIFAAGIAVFGDSVMSMRVLAVLATWLTAWGIWVLCSRLNLGRASALAAFIFPVMALEMGGLTANVEIFFSTFHGQLRARASRDDGR